MNPLRRRVLGALVAPLVVPLAPWTARRAQAADAAFVPPRDGRWPTATAAEVGMDATRVDAAMRFAAAHEFAGLRDLRVQIERDNARELYPEIVGPVWPRGPTNGVLIRHGRVVGTWGDPTQVDLSFSVAKSYLSLVLGLSIDRGLIGAVDEPVGLRVRDGGFDDPHNAPITWRMLVTMTSEWRGTLWNKPDVADRRRGSFRTLEAPGTFWEYNDVRANRLALSLTRLWRRPLGEVLADEIGSVIGGERRWYGYFDARVDLDGRSVESVSGGSHWGGGMRCDSYAHARFGLLAARSGDWGGRRVVSRDWFGTATTPVPSAPFYAGMWWLPHPDNPVIRRAPAGSFFALGSGGNLVYVHPARDLVLVARWVAFEQLEALVAQVEDAA